MLRLLVAKNCTFLIEQPQGSLLEKHDAFQQCCCHVFLPAKWCWLCACSRSRNTRLEV